MNVTKFGKNLPASGLSPEEPKKVLSYDAEENPILPSATLSPDMTPTDAMREVNGVRTTIIDAQRTGELEALDQGVVARQLRAGNTLIAKIDQHGRSGEGDISGIWETHVPKQFRA